MWKLHILNINYVLIHVWDMPYMHLLPLQYYIWGGIRECHTLQEYQQSTTMFVTLKQVVKDYNDYTYLSYNGRLVTDT